MKKITAFLGVLMSSMFVVQSVWAECTLNGEIIPCDQMPTWPFAFMGAFFIVMIVMMAFWIWMLVDVVRNEHDNDLLVWVIILMCANVLGAVIYYFVRKKGRNKVDDVNNETGNSSVVN